jgi:hypothetical protein
MPRFVPLLSALALALQLGAQGAPPKPAAAPKPGTPAQPAAPSTVAVPTANPNSADDLMTINATPYRPTLVRDPFATPTDAEQTNRGDLVDDIAVKGRVISNGKTFAVVSDARGNIRTLPIGYRFRDGVLVSIDEKAATFHQWDASSTNTKIFRTVVKIYKREEAKR